MDEEVIQIETRLPMGSLTEIKKWALATYIKGLRGNKARLLLQAEVLEKYNCHITMNNSGQIIHKATKEYLESLPMLDTQLAAKEAVIEMEDFENRIDEKLTRETAGKYQVLLDTKKQKHNLLGLGQGNNNIEINIGTDFDAEFLKSQNEAAVPVEVIKQEE